MAGVRQCMRLGQTAVRRISTNRPVNSVSSPEEFGIYKNLKTHQELFQKEDTIEDIYIKGGMRDAVLFKLILAGTVGGLIYDGILMYSLATET